MGLAFLITSDNLQLLSERKVLKEAEYAALLDAHAVVEAARDEAARLVGQASAQAQAARREGYEEGLRRARAEYAGKLVSDALAAERQLHALRSAMAQVVVKSLGQFVAEADPQALLESALQRVDTLVRAEPFVAIRVAPQQEAALRAALDRLRQAASWAMPVTITPDPSLAAGACVVQTASGTLEIGVDAQLEAFRRALERGAP